MASYDRAQGFEDEPPPRPATPPVRKGFLIALFWLSLVTLLVYGAPYLADRTGYAWESGRARAASETLAKLDKAGVINRASELFRLANTAVAPAVVNIRTLRADVQTGRRPQGMRRPPFQPQMTGLGSGVVIDKKHGYIVTNNHVIKDAQEILVRIGGRREVSASLVGADSKTDLAVLKVGESLATQAEWGDSEKLAIGDWVMAIGSPFALERTVTAGIVSATGRSNVILPDLSEDGYQSFIQTDAAINPGNSGGPLIDLTGKVVGINTAIYSETGGYQGIGLAIPSNMARGIVEQIIASGKVTRGYLGVAIREIGPDDAKRSGLKEPQGAMIVRVQPGGPADHAGLRESDIVVKLGDKAISDVSDLRTTTAGMALGSKVDLTYVREGAMKHASVVIAESPTVNVEKTLGFSLKEQPLAARGGLNGEANPSETLLVVESVVAGGPAEIGGLRPGMLIRAVGFRAVRTITEFQEAAGRINPEFQELILQVALPDGSMNWLKIPPAR